MAPSLPPRAVSTSGRVNVRRLLIGAIWLSVWASLFFLPGALNRWVFPKEAALLAACVLASRLAPTGRMPRWLVAMMAGGALLLTVAAVQDDAPIMQLLGRWPRYEGVITLTVYAAAVWLGARLFGPEANVDRSRIFMSAVAVASVALATVSILEASGMHPIPTTSDRPGALLGNATDQGILAAMFLAILVVPLVRAWVSQSGAPMGKGGKFVRVPIDVPWLPALGATAAGTSLVISASRGAVLGAAVVVVGLAALELYRRRLFRLAGLATALTPRRTLVTAAVVVVGGFASIVVVFPLIASRALGLTPLSSATIDDRALIYEAAMRLVSQSPFLGVGPSGFVDAVPPVLGVNWYSTVGQDQVLTSPHNWVFQALMAGGVGLGVLAVGLAVGALVVGMRRWRQATRALKTQGRSDHLEGAGLAILGFGAALMTHFTTPGTMLFAAVLLGSTLSVAPKREVASVLRELGSWLRTVLILVAMMTAALLAWSEIPLQEGVSAAAAGRPTEAAVAFDQSLAARPWDADAASIAAQALAQAAEAQAPGAAELAAGYARRALDATPHSLSAAKALAVGQQYAGDLAGAERTLRSLAHRVPLDAGVAQRLGGVQLLQSDYVAAKSNLVLATQIDPLNPATWLTLEYLYLQTGDAVAAAEAHRIAERLRVP